MQPPARDVSTMLAETWFTKPAERRVFPEHRVDADAVSTMLQAEMMLDGEPNENLATCVTTYASMTVPARA